MLSKLTERKFSIHRLMKSTNYVSNSDIFLGTSTRYNYCCDVMSKRKYCSYLAFDVSIKCMKLVHYLPLSNKFICNIKFLNPQRPSNVDSFVKRVTSVAKMMPTMNDLNG